MVDIGLGQPMPDDPNDPPSDLHSDLTDQQIEDALSGKTPIPEAKEDTDDDEPEAPQPEPPETQPEPSEHPEETSEEPKRELTAEERIAALEAANRVERLERERAEAVAERERYLHSRNAGELGYLKKLLSERQANPASEYEPRDVPTDELSSLKNDIASIKAERTQQAVAEEINNFQRAYPDAAKDEAGLIAIMQSKIPEYHDFLTGNDPKMARTIVRSLLKETYAEYRLNREQEVLRSAVKQSYDQNAKIAARKAASGPASTTRTAPIKSVAKSIDDLSDAEVEALADEYVRHSA